MHYKRPYTTAWCAVSNDMPSMHSFTFCSWFIASVVCNMKLLLNQIEYV